MGFLQAYQPQAYWGMSWLIFKMLINVCVLAGLLSLEDIFSNLHSASSIFRGHLDEEKDVPYFPLVKEINFP